MANRMVTFRDDVTWPRKVKIVWDSKGWR